MNIGKEPELYAPTRRNPNDKILRLGGSNLLELNLNPSHPFGPGWEGITPTEIILTESQSLLGGINEIRRDTLPTAFIGKESKSPQILPTLKITALSILVPSHLLPTLASWTFPP